MSKSIYCVGKMKGQQMQMIIAENAKEKKFQSKRVDIVTLKAIKENSMLYSNRKVNSPGDAVQIGRDFLEGADREEMIICCLNIKNEPNLISVISIGSLNSSIVHPREVLKLPILSNSASIIIYHNHPSGNPEPSQEDIDVTKRLKECCVLMGVELLDHIIIGDGTRYCSLKERGML